MSSPVIYRIELRQNFDKMPRISLTDEQRAHKLGMINALVEKYRNSGYTKSTGLTIRGENMIRDHFSRMGYESLIGVFNRDAAVRQAPLAATPQQVAEARLQNARRIRERIARERAETRAVFDVTRANPFYRMITNPVSNPVQSIAQIYPSIVNTSDHQAGLRVVNVKLDMMTSEVAASFVRSVELNLPEDKRSHVMGYEQRLGNLDAIDFAAWTRGIEFGNSPWPDALVQIKISVFNIFGWWYVTVTLGDKDSHKLTVEPNNREYRYTTDSGYRLETRLHSVRIVYRPIPGGCSSHTSEDSRIGNFVVRNRSSKNNNCAIVAVYDALGLQMPQNSSPRKKYSITHSDMLGSDDLMAIAKVESCFIRVFCSTSKLPICVFGSPSNRIVDLLLMKDHYRRIISGASIDAHCPAQIIAAKLPEVSQEEVIARICSLERNILLQGVGGTGKSHVLLRVKELLGDACVLTASTASAADLIGGITIDSYILRKHDSVPRLVIIDECSMIDGHKFARIVAHLDASTKLLLAGDTLQCPPVDCEKHGYFFQAPQFIEMSFESITLTKVYRASDEKFAAMLARFRLGTPTLEDYQLVNKRVAPAPADALVIAARRDIVAMFNETRLRELPGKKQSIGDFEFKIGAPVRVTRNEYRAYSSRIHNGQRGTIISATKEGVTVQFSKGNVYITPTVPFSFGMQIKENKAASMPLMIAFASTVHSLQGQTVHGKLHIVVDQLCDDSTFANGLLYTAISRVKTLDSITLSAEISGVSVDHVALTRELGGHVDQLACVESDAILERIGAETSPKAKFLRYTKAIDVKPWAELFFDFETAVCDLNADGTPNASGERVHKVYDAVAITRYETKEREVKQFFLRDHPEPIAAFAEYFCSLVRRYSEFATKRMSEVSGKQQTAQLRKMLSRNCVYLRGFNSSGFDDFPLIRWLDDHKSLPAAEFSWDLLPNAQIKYLTITHRATGVVVLRSHDMYLLLGCTLDAAYKSLCPKGTRPKIDFKPQVIDLKNRVFMDPNFRFDEPQPVSVHTFDPEIACGDGRRFMYSHTETYNPMDVINYCVRDVEALIDITDAYDVTLREKCGLTSLNYCTIGATTWAELTRSCAKNYSQDGKRLPIEALPREKVDFIRESIYGGRACPRLLHGTAGVAPFEDVKGWVYLDIKSMYASILENANLPMGTVDFAREDQLDALLVEIKAFAAANTWNKRGPIDYEPFRRMRMFVADCTFSENPHSLEPVIPEMQRHKNRIAPKSVHGLSYVLGERRAVITSLDIVLIIWKGGDVSRIHRAAVSSGSAPFAREWVSTCNKMKAAAEEAHDAAGKTLAKVLGNALYGQFLKVQHISRYIKTGSPAETDKFLVDNEMRSFTEVNDQEAIIIGVPRDTTSIRENRPTMCGSFVLAYSRLMLQTILSVANPNDEPLLQPCIGDTDSILLRDTQALVLREAGWFPVEPAFGCLTDELGDIAIETKVPRNSLERYIGPKRAKVILENTKDSMVCIAGSGEPGKEPKDEYRGRLWLATQFSAPAPKMLSVRFVDPIYGNVLYKSRSKGISRNAIVVDELNDGRTPIMSPAVIRDAEIGKGVTLMSSGMRRVSVIKKAANDALKAAAEKSLVFSVIDTMIMRHILGNDWLGRKHVDEIATVPYGYTPK